LPLCGELATSFKFFLFIFLRTLLRFFAFSCTFQKLNSLLFNCFRTLFAKKTGVASFAPMALLGTAFLLFRFLLPLSPAPLLLLFSPVQSLRFRQGEK
jgi:hypothetical protein